VMPKETNTSAGCCAAAASRVRAVTAVVIADDARPDGASQHHPMRMNVLPRAAFKLRAC
jgi:hypothetical protein